MYRMCIDILTGKGAEFSIENGICEVVYMDDTTFYIPLEEFKDRFKVYKETL